MGREDEGTMTQMGNRPSDQRPTDVLFIDGDNLMNAHDAAQRPFDP